MKKLTAISTGRDSVIKTALIFFEHQLPLAQSLLPTLEPKHPVFILDEALNADIQSFSDNFPEFTITLIEQKELPRALRRIRQALFAHVPSRSKPLIQELKKRLPVLVGIKPLIRAAKARLEKALKRSSERLLDDSSEALRRSLKVLVDDYEELVHGGLPQSAPKADISRAPKISGVKRSVSATLELKEVHYPFPLKGGLVLKADEENRPEVARLLTERIRRGRS